LRTGGSGFIVSAFGALTVTSDVILIVGEIDLDLGGIDGLKLGICFVICFFSLDMDLGKLLLCESGAY